MKMNEITIDDKNCLFKLIDMNRDLMKKAYLMDSVVQTIPNDPEHIVEATSQMIEAGTLEEALPIIEDFVKEQRKLNGGYWFPFKLMKIGYSIPPQFDPVTFEPVENWQGEIKYKFVLRYGRVVKAVGEVKLPEDSSYPEKKQPLSPKHVATFEWHDKEKHYTVEAA